MSRSRASVKGGYVRKTVSLPSKLVTDLERVLKKRSGLTMSALMTEAAEEYLRQVRSGAI
jgi:metal-responsive CopG/Arc/MetJ family transcriptional regulator